jgi:hypothetical protein
MPESSSKHTARSDSGEIATSTLAEIYAQQGLLGRALSIYRRMLARSPEDGVIADRIRSLEVRMAEAGPEPRPEPVAGPPAGRERLPWDPPEPEAAAPLDQAAPPAEQAAAPVDQAAATAPSVSEAGTVAVENEPKRPPADSPRGAGRMNAEAFRSWLEGR